MNRIFVLIIVTALFFSDAANAQYDGLVQQGEFGFSLGASHYFGDLNTRSDISKPKASFGLFFRKQMSDYIGVRVAGRFTQLGYSDAYSKNVYQKTRNLSFNSNLFEFTVQGDFNFFKFIPGSQNYFFTPYVTLGAGLFSYDPYTFYNGQKIYLRPLGTEGQAGGYLGRTEYGTMSVCIPFGVGIKYSLNAKTNLTFEIAQRFTTTDYLDDVSTTYAPKDPYFPDGPNGQPSIAYLLQDRSYEIDPTHMLSSVPGRQRGWSKQKDQYVIAEVGISFNISTYRCPSSF